MIYNVAQLLKSPAGTVLKAELDDADELVLEDGEATLAGPVTGHVRLHRTNQGIYVDGNAVVTVALTCTRCLDSFSTTYTLPLHEQFYPTIDIETGVPLPPPDDELSFPIDHNHLLDLREAIRQNLVLALPLNTICKEDCAGLCPQCGHNLNEGPCNCVPEQHDARFDSLRALLEQSEA